MKTLKREWAKLYWLSIIAIAALVLLGLLIPNDTLRGVCLILIAASIVGIIVSSEHLKCPYCGKGEPRWPQARPSEKTVYCPRCGMPFIFDDEVGKEKKKKRH